ncbi:hypothetical protein F4677DRAFT_439475 [Hypoxylon crocopeplum]|nr:hypothetical protein F4677DRAFT_439475 [Hypoxylon crocopeplum]
MLLVQESHIKSVIDFSLSFSLSLFLNLYRSPSFDRSFLNNSSYCIIMFRRGDTPYPQGSRSALFSNGGLVVEIPSRRVTGPILSNPSFHYLDQSGGSHDSRLGSVDYVPGPYFGNSPAVTFPKDSESILECWLWENTLKGRPLSFKHRSLLDHMGFALLDGAAEGRYVRWRILDREFWEIASPSLPYSQFVADQELDGPLPLYADVRQGGPIGEILVQLSKDPRRVRGLIVQLYGLPNEVPCSGCEKHFRSSESKRHAGMWPFFGCRSIPGAFSGICGNCFFSVEDSRCSFRLEDHRHFRADGDRDPPLVEDLTERNSGEISDYTGAELKRMMHDQIEGMG